jgi:flagellar biosynthesis protein FlhG
MPRSSTSNTEIDQAAGLRRIGSSHPVQVIAVTSGKGGVGKTNVSVNLAVAMAKAGRTVMLLDADLGLANVDVLLGLQVRANLSHVLEGSHTLEEIIVSGPSGISIVPASSGVTRMANLKPSEQAGLIRAFSELSHRLDTLVVDTAAGVTDSVMAFTRAAQEVVVVVCDEPASITDAYALIKVLSRDFGATRIHVLANMVQDEKEGRTLYLKLARACERFLDVTLHCMGTVPYDPALRKAVQRQEAVVEAFPGSPSGKAFKTLAQTAADWPAPNGTRGHLEFFVERLIGPIEESRGYLA